MNLITLEFTKSGDLDIESFAHEYLHLYTKLLSDSFYDVEEFTFTDNLPVLLDIINKISKINPTLELKLRFTFESFRFNFIFSNGLLSYISKSTKFESLFTEFSKDTRKYVNLLKFQTNIKSRMHYYKWNLSTDLSVRYYLHFEKDPEKEFKYFLKSHNNKEYTEISLPQAQCLINDLSTGYEQEIIGRLIEGVYEKIIVHKKEITQVNE